MQDELLKLGGQMIESSEGTRALALELCREFEEKFLLHITGGEVGSMILRSIAFLLLTSNGSPTRTIYPFLFNKRNVNFVV